MSRESRRLIEGSWTCEVCTLRNSKVDLHCIACGNYKRVNRMLIRVKERKRLKRPKVQRMAKNSTSAIVNKVAAENSDVVSESTSSKAADQSVSPDSIGSKFKKKKQQLNSSSTNSITEPDISAITSLISEGHAPLLTNPETLASGVHIEIQANSDQVSSTKVLVKTKVLTKTALEQGPSIDAKEELSSPDIRQMSSSEPGPLKRHESPESETDNPPSPVIRVVRLPVSRPEPVLEPRRKGILKPTTPKDMLEKFVQERDESSIRTPRLRWDPSVEDCPFRLSSPLREIPAFKPKNPTSLLSPVCNLREIPPFRGKKRPLY